jgi:glycosyltransferase involved in cell wall biosynthesis
VKVVMFVYNDATYDSRVLREAATLAAAGHQVTLMAMLRSDGGGPPEREQRDGFDIVRIAVPHDWWTWWRRIVNPAVHRERAGRLWHKSTRFKSLDLRGALDGLRGIISNGTLLGLRSLWLSTGGRRQRRGADGDAAMADAWPPETATWLASWRWSILGWANAAAVAAPLADVYHGHDLTGLPAARAAARRNGGLVVYDSHEIYVDSGRAATRPAWVRRLMRWLEWRWSRGIAALVSVNHAYADVLVKRLHPRRTAVVHNCPPRWQPPLEPRDHLRETAGIGPGHPVVLYHGALTSQRGLEELAAAMLEPGLEMAHLVYLGYGSSRSQVEALAAEPRFGGRLHVLEAVEPGVLLDWITTADVDAIPLQRSTLNHYLCTPNKLFESIAAGVPVVVSDFPVMRSIAMDDPAGPLGAVCQPADPVSIGGAIRSLLTLDPDERAAMRRRCVTAARERWNWETESARLLEVYRELADRSG